MDVLIVGLGVIGTSYGYVFNESGVNVEHYIRKNSSKAKLTDLNVEFFDGRNKENDISFKNTYRVIPCSKKKYDFIFVSVPSGGIESVITDLNNDGIQGTIILCCGIWYDKEKLNLITKGRKYILGYPVAGGNIIKNKLTFCLFDNFMIEKRDKSDISNYDDLVKLFTNCDIKLESPYDMLEWIWLHMAINAGIGVIAGSYGDINDTSSAAENLMDSNRLLRKGILAIRETIRIVQSRGVKLSHYSNELLICKVPAIISAPIMKRMFLKNILARKIMTLHGNISDLVFVYKSLYDTGKANSVNAPIFYNNYEKIINKLK